MKTLLLMPLFSAACIAIVALGSAHADPMIFTGSSTFTGGAGLSMQVTTSPNVYLFYNGNANGQTYGAAAKNKWGDKYFATGGGQTASPGIYFLQNDTFVGSTDFSTDGAAPDNIFVPAPGWASPGK
ncbi:MAG TPA: hypothetical protein VEI57_13200 [Nitrospirota bacterium]|nr:hypothetical protein [Nitrospirota bacterium]